MKKHIIAAVISVVLASSVLASQIMAASVQPGSTGDPLVSKSYVDDKINQVISMLSGGAPTTQQPTIDMGSVSNQEIVAGVLSQIEFLYGDRIGASSYVPVSASKGQVLLGKEGTEIILRSGKAVGNCSGENGIVDATDGKEIFNGTEVMVNHMLIVPRDDGRGVSVTEDAWFIVKGGYTLN